MVDVLDKDEEKNVPKVDKDQLCANQMMEQEVGEDVEGSSKVEVPAHTYRQPKVLNLIFLSHVYDSGGGGLYLIPEQPNKIPLIYVSGVYRHFGSTDVSFF